VDTLIGIENLKFFDGNYTIDQVIASSPLPKFTSINSNGSQNIVNPTLYSGPVAFLEYQLLGNNQTGDVIIGSLGNDFMNLLGGDDAANGGMGDDVLDGGTGSNFLTGGGDNDTFFLDGRGGNVTWSTITDFNFGDQINIWGWTSGISKQVFALENQGADGYKGATFHYDLNNDGLIDTSITFTGIALSQVPQGVAMDVSGNGYLFIG
jgi:serralysin